MASRAPGVENERVVRYGSTIRRAVPATGRANRLAVKATPHHAAKFSAKHKRAMRRQAQSKRNEVTICQAKKARQGGRWVRRIEPAMRLGKMVMLACD